MLILTQCMALTATLLRTVTLRTDTFARTFVFAASFHVVKQILIARWRRTLLTCFGRVVLLANWAEILVQGHDRIARCLAFATSIIIRVSCSNTGPHTNRNNNPNRNPQDLQLLTALHVRIACVYCMSLFCRGFIRKHIVYRCVYGRTHICVDLQERVYSVHVLPGNIWKW